MKNEKTEKIENIRKKDMDSFIENNIAFWNSPELEQTIAYLCFKIDKLIDVVNKLQTTYDKTD